MNANLPDMHVIVIGAGLLGVSSAYFLRCLGVDVTVLESEESPALGASYGNGGYNQASVADPWNAPGVLKLFTQAWVAGLTGGGERSAFVTQSRALPGLIGWGLKFLKNANAETYYEHTVANSRLAKFTVETLEELDEIEQLSYSQSDAGALVIFRSEESLAAYGAFTQKVCQHATPFEILDRDALIEKEPSLTSIATELVGAVYFPSDRAANSRIFCEQLAATTANRGTEFVFGAAVKDIAASAVGVTVATAKGDYRADAVVIAAGVASRELVRPLGIRLPIAPAKGYSISIPMKDWANPLRHVVVDMGVHAGVNPMGDVLRVAGTAEFAGMRPGVSEERADYLIELTRKIFPDFAATINRDEIDPWGGFRPLSADGLPMIGSTHVQNVYLNTGHGGLGWTQAAGSGKAIADHIVGADNAFDISDYSIRRFKK